MRLGNERSGPAIGYAWWRFQRAQINTACAVCDGWERVRKSARGREPANLVNLPVKPLV